MKLIEQVRGVVVRQSISGASFAADWPVRRHAIREHLGSQNEVQRDGVIGLGDRLSDLFTQQTRAVGHSRDQSSVSGGGVVWDTLVNFYLNMCFAGTDVVVLRERQIPDSIRRSCQVTFQDARIDAGVDHVALAIPGASTWPAATNGEAVAQFASIVSSRFDDITAIVLSCKTNWNDNVQTPMLWSLLYRLRATGAQPPADIAIGAAPFSLERMVDFDFAYVTVPSNRVDQFHARSMPVLRGQTMSGGVFWGRPTKTDVARSLREFGAYQGTMREAFPVPDMLGAAFSSEVRDRRGLLDLDAFDLY